jgi:methylphosphotriester-DNA--protein-cysteine methyltransferase
MSVQDCASIAWWINSLARGSASGPHADQTIDLARRELRSGAFSADYIRLGGSIQQRVAKAKRLLQETNMSIIEVGMAVGYSSPSHFAQTFRRETGLSPSDYRRR